MTRRRHATPPPAAVPPAPPPPVPPPAEPVQLHTIEAAAMRLSISPRTLRTQIAAGRIRVVRIGHSIRISEAELRRVSVEGASA